MAPKMTPEQRRRREEAFLAWVGTRIDWHHWMPGHALIREAFFAGRDTHEEGAASGSAKAVGGASYATGSPTAPSPAPPNWAECEWLCPDPFHDSTPQNAEGGGGE